MTGFGVALSGGGAKGGYHIGVWQALRELNIPIGFITGTSVGGLNGALMTQNDFELAYKLWSTITVDKVVKMKKQIETSDENSKKNFGIYNSIKKAIISGGLDISPLTQLLNEIIDEKKIRESKIDFGIVTFSLSDFKPVKLFKDNIPLGLIKDYLLASACFPIFKLKKINKKVFIDGGICDNVPISLLLEKNIKNIIAVDLSAPGIVKKVDTYGANVITIKNSQDLGGILDFNGEQSKINIELGYYDTLKAFGKLKGRKYYVIPSNDHTINKSKYIGTLTVEDFIKMYQFLGLVWSDKPVPINTLIIYKIMSTISKYSDGKLSADTAFSAMAEISAEQLGIKKRKKYKFNELIEEILKQYENINKTKSFNIYLDQLNTLIKNRKEEDFNKDFKKALTEGKFLIFYNPDFNLNDEKIKMFRRFIAIVFPKISIANMFVSLLLSRDHKKAI